MLEQTIFMQTKLYIPPYQLNVVRKGPPSFLRHPPLDSACPHFKIFVSPLLTYLRQFPLPATPSFPNLDTPTIPTHNQWVYQKGDFSSSTVAFYQKSVFHFLNSSTNISGYLNLWDIFRFIFRGLRMIFFHKIMVTEKNNFSSNAQHNSVKSKVI